MKQENNNVPLYKVLNSERTEGKWNAVSSSYLVDGKSIKGFNILGQNNGINVCNFVAGQNTDRVEPICKANAEYTALAVNHLATLAEILEEEVKYKENLPFATEREIQFLIKAKEALKAIS